MARKDTLIKAGKKIADDWTSTSADYQELFISFKKQNVKWEKYALRDLENRMGVGFDPQQIIRELEKCRDYLIQHRSNGDREYKRHFNWVRDVPREGAAGICKTLKLDSDDPDYDAVMDGLKRVLIANTKQFSATEASWTKDLLPQLKLLKNKMNTLTKIAKGDIGISQAYLQQFEKSKRTYAKMVKTTIAELKLDATQADIKRVLNPGFLQGNPKALLVVMQSYQVKEGKINRLGALFDKNFKRIMKSIPTTYKKNSWIYKSFGVDQFRDDHADAMDTLVDAKRKYQQFLANFEDTFPEIYNG